MGSMMGREQEADTEEPGWRYTVDAEKAYDEVKRLAEEWRQGHLEKDDTPTFWHRRWQMMTMMSDNVLLLKLFSCFIIE